MRQAIKLTMIVLIGLLAMSLPATAFAATPEQKTILHALNEKRAEVGIAPLKWSTKLEKAARKHSKDMVAKNYTGHTSPSGVTLGNRLKNNGLIKWRKVGEVYTDAATPLQAVENWRDRRSNRRKLYDSRFTHVGIGITRGGDNGKTYTINLVRDPKFKKKVVISPAKALLKMLNDKRRDLGMAPVAWHAGLEDAGRRHSRDMMKNKYFSHVSGDGRTLVERLRESNVIGWTRAGENLVGTNSVARAFELWMGSDAHRENMLRPDYTHVGIGMAVEDSYYIFTMDLAQNPS